LQSNKKGNLPAFGKEHRYTSSTLISNDIAEKADQALMWSTPAAIGNNMIKSK